VAEPPRPPASRTRAPRRPPQSPFLAPFVEGIERELGWLPSTCVPADNQSWVGKAVTRGPVTLHRRGERFATVSGSPAATVNLAMHSLRPGGEAGPGRAGGFDLVLSGPNIGHNSGRGFLLSSGTVGAALEGVLQGARAVAVSFPFLKGFGNFSPEELDVAVAVSARVVAGLWADWPPGTELFNVNVPLGAGLEDVAALNGAEGMAAGCAEDSGVPVEWVSVPGPAGAAVSVPVVRTTVSRLGYGPVYGDGAGEGGARAHGWDPRGVLVWKRDDAEPGSDVWAIRRGAVSVTPLVAGLAAPPA